MHGQRGCFRILAQTVGDILHSRPHCPTSAGDEYPLCFWTRHRHWWHDNCVPLWSCWSWSGRLPGSCEVALTQAFARGRWRRTPHGRRRLFHACTALYNRKHCLDWMITVKRYAWRMLTSNHHQVTTSDSSAVTGHHYTCRKSTFLKLINLRNIERERNLFA